VQAVCDGAVVAVNEVDKAADFGEGEVDEAPMDGWRGFGFCGFLGWVVVVGLSGVVVPLFLVWCAVRARKVWASMARVICWCQASQVRTW
jgi:hypothetical protein